MLKNIKIEPGAKNKVAEKGAREQGNMKKGVKI